MYLYVEQSHFCHDTIQDTFFSTTTTTTENGATAAISVVCRMHWPKYSFWRLLSSNHTAHNTQHNRCSLFNVHVLIIACCNFVIIFRSILFIAVNCLQQIWTNWFQFYICICIEVALFLSFWLHQYIPGDIPYILFTVYFYFEWYLWKLVLLSSNHFLEKEKMSINFIRNEDANYLMWIIVFHFTGFLC